MTQVDSPGIDSDWLMTQSISPFFDLNQIMTQAKSIWFWVDSWFDSDSYPSLIGSSSSFVRNVIYCELQKLEKPKRVQKLTYFFLLVFRSLHGQKWTKSFGIICLLMAYSVITNVPSLFNVWDFRTTFKSKLWIFGFKIFFFLLKLSVF